MHPLKFVETCIIRPPEKDSLMFNPEVAAIYDRFYTNMGLAVSSTMLPGYVFWTALEWASASTKANTDIIGSHRHPMNENESNRVGKRAEQYFEQVMKSDTETWKENIKDATATVERFVMHSGPYIWQMTYGLLQSMIVSAHTAYEVYVTDLLEKLRISHPGLFPTDSFTYKSTAKFESAYKKGFSEPSITAAVLTPEIRALALLRNAIVHANGYADDWFMNPAKDGYPTNVFLMKHLPLIQEWDVIKIDGQLVRLLIESCSDQARILAIEVNKWLLARIPKS